MLTTILLSTCVIILIYGFLKFCAYRPEGYPPGPPRLPIFGSLLFILLTDFYNLHKAVLKFAKWYNTNIVGFYVGDFQVVSVHSAEGVREVLRNSNYDGRPQGYLAQLREPNGKIVGIFFKEGPGWVEQRRFILRYLRDFGFGRRFQELEMIIQEEMTDMLDVIRNGPKYEHEKSYVKDGGLRILLPYFFNPYSANSLFHIMFNERRPRNEQLELWQLVRYTFDFQRNGSDYGRILSVIPWIRHIFHEWSGYNTLKESSTFMYKFFEEIVDRHISTYDKSCERNFLDLYISEMKKAEKVGNAETTTFKHNQLILSLVDFSFPAYSAVGTQMTFMVQYFLLYPECQKKIQQELDSVVGFGRLPTLEDRKFCNYTEACIREILRIQTLVSSNVPHKALCDTELMGYKIPKETIVIPSLNSYNHDKSVWGDPENFRPERFLDEQCKLRLNKDLSLPFGAGKRLCAGETFARNMLFLMTSTLCQNYNFVLGPNDKLPDLYDTITGIIITPRDFWVQLEERR